MMSGNYKSTPAIERISPRVTASAGKQSPKVLVNPYHGCTHRCLFCPANDGFLRKHAFEEFREKGVVKVVENIVDHVAAYLQLHPEATVAHLSPVADPFQPIDREIGLSDRVMEYCASAGLALAVCSKGIISERTQQLLLQHPRSFAQVSIMTPVEEKRRFIVRGDGASTEELLGLIEQMVGRGILVIGRIDPIFPYITDDLQEFRQLVGMLRDRGVKHVVSSVVDISYGALEREYAYLDSYEDGLAEQYKQLFTDDIGGRSHARLEYRREIFGGMLDICKEMRMGFGITWEPGPDGNSLAAEFSVGAPKHLQEALS